MDAANTWTDERVELLTKLWASGRSASQIAAEIGGVTRNAVIGKVHRLGLSGRGKAKSPSANPSSPRPRRSPKSEATSSEKSQNSATIVNLSSNSTNAGQDIEAVSVEETEIAILPSERVALVDLRETMCRWPLGDPMSTDFGFCGRSSASGLPYCANHCRIAYQPVADRRRDRRAS